MNTDAVPSVKEEEPSQVSTSSRLVRQGLITKLSPAREGNEALGPAADDLVDEAMGKARGICERG